MQALAYSAYIELCQWKLSYVVFPTTNLALFNTEALERKSTQKPDTLLNVKLQWRVALLLAKNRETPETFWIWTTALPAYLHVSLAMVMGGKATLIGKGHFMGISSSY